MTPRRSSASDAIGHQALTAGFVDGSGPGAGSATVTEKPRDRMSDGGSQTRRATAYDKDAGLFGQI